MDFSGVIHAVGSSVTEFKVGDRVYGMAPTCGAASEYLLLSSSLYPPPAVAKMPSNLSFAEAASLPLVGLTGIAVMSRAESSVPGGIKGKMVFVPAGLSGTGSIGVQLAKHVFEASNVITTVSTSKVPLVPDLLGEGTVDKVVDYTTQDIFHEVSKQSVDLVYDTRNPGMPYLSLLKPRTGFLATIATPPTSARVKHDIPESPWVIRYLLDMINMVYNWRAKRWTVKYENVQVIPRATELERLTRWVEEGKVKAVVGKSVKLSDLEGVRECVRQVIAGKGGVGKFVIETV